MKRSVLLFTATLAAGFGPLLHAQTSADVVPTGTASAPAAGADTVLLDPFNVSSGSDHGYTAGNTISATRIATEMNNLPFSISAFTPQYIADTGAKSLLDVASQSAGVKSGVSATTQGNAVFSVRGFVQAPQRNGFASNQLVSNYVDTSVIERVEVVKGPASLLYGAIAPGGTVNYITKVPELKEFTEVDTYIGSYNSMGVSLDANQPLIANKLYFRVVATYENGEQYYQNQKSRTVVIFPTIKWKITPKATLSVDYQGFQQRQMPPAVYLPNTVIGTPASILKSLYAAGNPGPSSALASKTGPAVAENVDDASDPGFMGVYPGLPRNFNYADISDVKLDNLKTIDAELTVNLNEHWTGRAHVQEDVDRSSYSQTGHAAAYIAPPNSMLYTGGVWTVAPSWAALASDQQVAQSLAYANTVRNHLSLLSADTQNGVGSPVIMDRAQRVQLQSTQGTTVQAETVGTYNFPSFKVQLLTGIFYDHVSYNSSTTQNKKTAASPFFRAWDVNPSSPSYYVNTDEGVFNGTQLSSVAANATTYNSDEAAYALLNLSFFQNRLLFVGGLRYNVSSNDTNDLTGGGLAPGLRATYTTPQVGLGYKITPDIMVYGSYSESYTLPTQPYLTTAGIVNGVESTIPAGATHPTIGKGEEVGVKGTFLEGTLNTTLSLYQVEESNVLIFLNQNIAGVSINIYNQGAKQRGRGVEASADWSIRKNWQFVASVSEEDIRNVKEPYGLEYYLGQNVGYTAKPSAHVWTRYELLNRVKGLWFGGGVDYFGKNAGDPRDAAYFLPAYTVVNSAVGYSWTIERTHLTATLNFKNMGNSFYKETPQSIGEPRRLLLSCTLRF
jgi:iron complex outermembrane receptor protein